MADADGRETLDNKTHWSSLIFYVAVGLWFGITDGASSERVSMIYGDAILWGLITIFWLWVARVSPRIISRKWAWRTSGCFGFAIMAGLIIGRLYLRIHG